MDREVIEIELTAEERALILQYGYPFDGIEQSLKACQDSKGIETVPIDTFELERLIGDGSARNAEMLGYMLRGFFVAIRRHVKWENATVLPLARQTLTEVDLDELREAIIERARKHAGR